MTEEYFDILNSDGTYSGNVASRKECHEKGLWHRAVIIFVINKEGKILLQKRSANKKMWPNLWDLTAGGHVLTGELGYQAIIREAKEELNLDVKKEELTYVGSFISENVKPNIINRHFNEFFIIKKDVNINDITLQEEEVQDIRWFTKEEIFKKIDNNYDGITDKKACWAYLKKYLELK